MRRLTLLLLLATVAAPALAQSDNPRGGRHHRSDSSEQQSEGGAQRSSEARRSEQRATAIQPFASGSADRQGRRERMREQIQLQRQQTATTIQSGANDNVRIRRSQHDGADGQTQSSLRPRERRIRTIPDTSLTATQPSASQREAFQGRSRRDYRDGNYNRWSNDWRHDRRYDWHRYRDRHRSIFRLGFYYDPFGWNYRRWSHGSYLYPSYYRSSFWLNDPWQYRLPPAYGPYRWVRYWNDALLVNIYTGQVVDVVHGFFW